MWQENYRSAPEVAQQGDRLTANYWINPPKATIIGHGPEPAWHLEQHDYVSGFTGHTCEKMLTDDQGYGDPCGRGVDHPCHQKWRETEGARTASIMIENGGSSDPTDAPIDHDSGEAAAGADGVTPTVRGRVYVSGPCTGVPDHNYPAFQRAASELQRKGFETEDPSTTELPEGSPWSEYMREALVKLMSCDGIALLPGWEESRGAKLEVQVALAIGGFRINPIEEWTA